MRIDEELRLVLPLGDDRFCYHTPITEEVFRANFKILASTRASLFGRGLAYAADVGPQIATLTLVDEGEQLARERHMEGDHGASALLSELKRLTTVLVPTDSGWKHEPVAKSLDEAEWREVESRVVFFTCLYALSERRNQEEAAQAGAGILGGRITSSKSSDLNAFLRAWTEEPTSGEKPTEGASSEADSAGQRQRALAS